MHSFLLKPAYKLQYKQGKRELDEKKYCKTRCGLVVNLYFERSLWATQKNGSANRVLTLTIIHNKRFVTIMKPLRSRNLKTASIWRWHICHCLQFVYCFKVVILKLLESVIFCWFFISLRGHYLLMDGQLTIKGLNHKGNVDFDAFVIFYFIYLFIYLFMWNFKCLMFLWKTKILVVSVLIFGL